MPRVQHFSAFHYKGVPLFFVIFTYTITTLPRAELSLARYSDTAVYPNNSVIDTNLVGEGFEGAQITDGGALECHTDDTTCCRGIDNPDGTGRGEWYYPDGTIVPSPGGDTNIYRTRGHMVIRLNRVDGSIVKTSANGLYKCEIPGVGGGIIRTITLIQAQGKNRSRVLYTCNNFIIEFIADTCDDLIKTNNLDIVYTPPRDVSGLGYLSAGQRYTGTIATYSCSPGYQLVGGSSLRACGPDRNWNGTQPLCQSEPQKRI